MGSRRMTAPAAAVCGSSTLSCASLAMRSTTADTADRISGVTPLRLFIRIRSGPSSPGSSGPSSVMPTKRIVHFDALSISLWFAPLGPSRMRVTGTRPGKRRSSMKISSSSTFAGPPESVAGSAAAYNLHTRAAAGLDLPEHLPALRLHLLGDLRGGQAELLRGQEDPVLGHRRTNRLVAE